MQSFANVYITARVRASLQKVLQVQQHKKFWSLVSLLKQGRFEIPGLNVEKLHSSARSDKLYSARLSRDLRVIFSMGHDAHNLWCLTIHELNHHDLAYDRANRLAENRMISDAQIEQVDDLLFELQKEELEKLTDEMEFERIDQLEAREETLQFFKVPDYLLADPSKYIQFERSLDRYLLLTDEQQEILSLEDQALLIQGPAGTGKTTLALFQALRLYESHANDSIFLFTYHEELACVCRAYKVNLLGDDDTAEEISAELERGDSPAKLQSVLNESTQSGIKVFSYLEFIKSYLRKEFSREASRKSWISKQQSLETLRRILSQKNRWERKFSPEELYGLIYSILKGRFVPGSEALPSDKNDYRRIFKDYGREPEDLDEILEILSIYQNRLEINNQLDEADIIRLSYQQLKNKALLGKAEQKLWIIIDEVQDFTELEWKSILLFWENQVTRSNAGESYPFICGDVNQNISRSGFRWQEVEAYLRSILSNLRRPKAIKRIALHKNYRNTKQIHQLASFVRRFGSDTSDLGLPSEQHGPPAIFCTCSEQQMISALRTIDSSYSAMNPLVVLVEDEQALDRLRENLIDCRNIFLLSLRNSKGMEFEDVIIYRMFSSAAIAENQTTAETSRLFDLWYMGICRARRNLMMVLAPDDLTNWKKLLQNRFEEFCRHVIVLSEENFQFEEFLARRQLTVPDYNVIFLERRIAADLWHQYITAGKSKYASDNQEQADARQKAALHAKERALSLWRRCLDYASLGRAHRYLKEYSQAIPLLTRSGLLVEAAECLLLCERYSEAAAIYEKLGILSEAAHAYFKGASFEKAAELFETLTEWKLAAESYRKAGKLSKAAEACEKSGMHEAAAEIYKSKGNHLAAAESFFQAEEFESAAEMFLKADEKLEAARCYYKSGQYEQAKILFLELNQMQEAAESSEKIGSFLEAANFYAKAGDLLSAAFMHEKAQQYEEAAQLYLQLGEHARAAKAFEQSQMPFEAAIAFEHSGDFEKALHLAKESSNKIVEARCHERLGDYRKAADCYKETGNLNEAAYCLEKIGNLDEAADLYGETENYAQAASCLLKLERRMEAAKLLIMSAQVSAAFELCMGQQNRLKNNSFFTELIQWCRDNRRTSSEAQLFELSKDFASAAQKYRDCLMLTKAASCYEKSGKLLDAAKTYIEAVEFEKAADCYKSLKKWKDAAQCFERIQKWAEAKALYERCNDRDGIARCASALNWMP
ncbi:MAG: UvrD-helicase domain-containing protein [Candidatus Obscuribacterales bacterium]|jgi:DNA polymerase III delta prime subunit|nr:UvrD-helicase domain-containing protein [Candidatus Obscuribacterales bacterium]